MKPSFKDHLTTWLLKVLPQHALAAVMYKVARSRWKPLKNLIIRQVIKRYDVDLLEARISDPSQYGSFNEFFTRALNADARPVASDPDSIVCPADGKVSQVGEISGGRLIQAKGHDYPLLDLLAGNKALADEFSDGNFATIYLSPKDYHRVHMPAGGTLREMHFVPGQLFSVSEATTQLVPGLFARNERVISIFETDRGPLAVILVGAIFVGSMETVWNGEVRGSGRNPRVWKYEGQFALDIPRGEEMGRFNMGSTVILLFPPGVSQWNVDLLAGKEVRMGESIGRIKPSAK